jgi:hypothetical protein
MGKRFAEKAGAIPRSLVRRHAEQGGVAPAFSAFFSVSCFVPSSPACHSLCEVYVPRWRKTVSKTVSKTDY